MVDDRRTHHRGGRRLLRRSESFDVTTEGGRLGVRIMLALAQFDFERTSAAWRTACEHAISRGLHFGGTPGMGYRKLRSGRLCPNPQTSTKAALCAASMMLTADQAGGPAITGSSPRFAQHPM